MAEAITVKSSERVVAAGLEITTENVAGHGSSIPVRTFGGEMESKSIDATFAGSSCHRG